VILIFNILLFGRWIKSINPPPHRIMLPVYQCRSRVFILSPPELHTSLIPHIVSYDTTFKEQRIFGRKTGVLASDALKCSDYVASVADGWITLYCTVRAVSIANSQHSDQQNAQYCTFHMYITISRWTLLRVSTHKGSSSVSQTKPIPHKTKLATFIHSWHGAKGSKS
jgi:hypothetical protein